jgi:hypothetical protein
MENEATVDSELPLVDKNVGIEQNFHSWPVPRIASKASSIFLVLAPRIPFGMKFDLVRQESSATILRHRGRTKSRSVPESFKHPDTLNRLTYPPPLAAAETVGRRKYSRCY